MSILAWVILGLIAGCISSKIANESGKGIIVDLVLGIVGAVVGGWRIHLPILRSVWRLRAKHLQPRRRCDWLRCVLGWLSCREPRSLGNSSLAWPCLRQSTFLPHSAGYLISVTAVTDDWSCSS